MKKSGSSTVPKFSGANALQTMMMTQAMLGQKAEDEGDITKGRIANVGEDIKRIAGQFPSGKPPIGSKYNVKGPAGDISVDLNPKFTVDEVRTMGMSDAINYGVGYILDQQKNNPNFRNKYLKATAKLGNEKIGNIGPISTTGPFSEYFLSGKFESDKEAGMIKDYLVDLSDRVLRLRSGAQINEQEMKRMLTLLPTWEDAMDNDQSYERMNRKLAKFSSEMNSIKERIMTGRMLTDTGEIAKYNPDEWGETLDKFNIAGERVLSNFNQKKGNSPFNPLNQIGKQTKPQTSYEDSKDPMGLFNG